MFQAPIPEKQWDNSSSPTMFRTCSDFKRQIQLAIMAGWAERGEITFQDEQRIIYVNMIISSCLFLSSSWCGFLLPINSPCPKLLTLTCIAVSAMGPNLI